MRSIYFSGVVLLLFTVFCCTKEPEKVVQPEYATCDGTASFRKDTTLVNPDTLENTFFTNDSTFITGQRSTRMDIRLRETNGNRLVVTLSDLVADSVPTPGLYHSSSSSRLARMWYYGPNYQSSGYVADTVAVNLASFNRESLRCSGTFSGILIHPVKKDTIRIRNGSFTSICVSKI